LRDPGLDGGIILKYIFMKDDVTGPEKVPVADFYESGNELSRSV
jgi:hypothetical protein